jgi:hypothetical protein
MNDPLSGRNWSSTLGHLASYVFNPTRRQYLLLTFGYVCGFVGLILSFFGDPTGTESGIGTAGLGLMGLSFVCLFLVSIGMSGLARRPKDI